MRREHGIGTRLICTIALAVPLLSGCTIGASVAAQGDGAMGGPADDAGASAGDGATAAPGIDPSLRIAALSDSQAQAWCTWFLSREPVPPSVLVESTPGVADLYAGNACYNPLNLCVSFVPLEICAQNLRLFPCQATVAQLNDCALTISNRCTLVGGGCAPFEAAANCSQTFVQTTNQSLGAHCAVRYRF